MSLSSVLSPRAAQFLRAPPTSSPRFLTLKFAGTTAVYQQHRNVVPNTQQITCIRLMSTVLRRGAPKKLTQSYIYTPSPVPLLGLTIGQTVDALAEEGGNELALVSRAQNIRKNYEHIKKESDELAAAFISLGFQRGDRLALWGHNTYEWLICWFAAAKAGLVMVALNPVYQAAELEYSLKRVKVKGLIVAENIPRINYSAVIDQVLPEAKNATSSTPHIQSKRFPDLKFVFHMTSQNEAGNKGITIADICQNVSNEDRRTLDNLQNKIQFDDPVTIMFTSGTTGSPKAAVLSHYNIVNNAYLSGIRFDFPNKKPIYCVPAPLFHCMGSVVGVFTTLIHLGTAVLPSPLPSPVATLEAVQEEKVSAFDFMMMDGENASFVCRDQITDNPHVCRNILGTPTMFIDILHHPDFEKYDVSSLETGLIGGASCLEEVLREMKERFGLEAIGTGFGTTENSPVTSCVSRDDPPERQFTTVGKALYNTEIKIVDDKGDIVPVNTPGEILSRGHHVFLGYWGDPEKTNEVITPARWYRTGDIGVMDEDGYLRIVGRIKDMIIRGGENIYPVEIENFLHKHPAIAEAHIIGVPDVRLGEQVCAWIKLKDGQTLSEQDVKDFCKGKISTFKIPHYVVFVESFPVTQSGKVQKNKLCEEAIKRFNLKR